jgi:DNA-binding MarR family transcriptional regulator
MAHPATESLILNAATLTEIVSEALAPVLAEQGLTQSAFDLLTTIRAGGGTIPQAEIARRLGISPPTLSEAIRSLVAAGLVEQRGSGTDRRIKTLAITSVGSRRLNRVLAALHQLENELTLGISPAEISAVNAMLRNAAKNLALKVANQGNPA